jgi:hypothetical protein
LHYLCDDGGQFRIAHLTNRSDLTELDVLHILKTDEAGLNDLIQFDIQTSMKQKCPREFLVSGVCKLYFEERHVNCGKRLADFKAKGGYANDVINFKKVCSYVVEFDAAGDLKSIKHISGDIKNITMKTGLTKGHLLNDNFDDYQAHLVLQPMPKVLLCSFFNKTALEGPWRVTCYNKASDLLARATELYNAYDASETALSMQVLPGATLQTEISDHRAAAKIGVMSAARAKAQTALGAKKLRRASKCDGS